MGSSARERGMAAMAAAAWAGLKRGCLGSLYILRKRQGRGSLSMGVLAGVVRLLQLAAFVLQASHAYTIPWDAAIVAPLRTAAGVVTLEYYWDRVSAPTYHAIFFLACAWVALFLSLFAYAGLSFSTGDVRVLWPLRLLLAIGSLSATVGFVPLLEALLSVFQCPVMHHWADGGYTCYAGAHLALTVVAGLLAAVFLGLCACFTVLTDSHPLSPAATAKTAGHLDWGMLVLKASLVLVANVIPANVHGGGDTMAGIVVLANGVAAVVWLRMVLWYLPMLHDSMNLLYAVLPSVYLWVVCCAGMTLAAPAFAFTATSFAYVGVPFAAAAGAGAYYATRHFILSVPPTELRSVYDVDYRVRTMLKYALADALATPHAPPHRRHQQRHSHHHHGGCAGGSPVGAHDGGGGAAGGGPSSGSAEDHHAALLQSGAGGGDGARGGDGLGGSFLSSLSRGIRGGALGGGGGGGGNRHHLARTHHLSLDDDSRAFSGDHGAVGSRGGPAPELERITFGVLDADARAEIARQRLPPAVVDSAEQLYRTASARFPSSAALHLLQARFYSVYRSDRRLAMSHYLQASRMDSSLHVQLLAHSARRDQDSEAAGSGDLSLMQKVAFEKHLSDGKAATRRAITAQCHFWGELGADVPSIGRLHAVATVFAQAAREAERTFEKCLSLNSTSLVTLRLFGLFSLSVASKDKAAVLLAEAERIEDIKSREHAGGSSSVDGFSFRLFAEAAPEVLADATAMLTLGATPRDLAVIHSATPAAGRLLGFSRFQLERRSLSACLAPGLGDQVIAILKTYIATGEAPVAMTDTVRAVLGRTKSGAVVPLHMSIRDMPSTDGGSPVLVALLREIHTTEEFLVCSCEGGRGRYRVQGASAGALAHLGMDASSLAGSGLALGDLVEDLADMHDALLQPGGGVVHLATSHTCGGGGGGVYGGGDEGDDEDGGSGGGSGGSGSEEDEGAAAGSAGQRQWRHRAAGRRSSPAAPSATTPPTSPVDLSAAGLTLLRVRARLQVVNLRPAPTALLVWQPAPLAAAQGCSSAHSAESRQQPQQWLAGPPRGGPGAAAGAVPPRRGSLSSDAVPPRRGSLSHGGGGCRGSDAGLPPPCYEHAVGAPGDAVAAPSAGGTNVRFAAEVLSSSTPASGVTDATGTCESPSESSLTPSSGRSRRLSTDGMRRPPPVPSQLQLLQLPPPQLDGGVAAGRRPVLHRARAGSGGDGGVVIEVDSSHQPRGASVAAGAPPPAGGAAGAHRRLSVGGAFSGKRSLAADVDGEAHSDAPSHATSTTSSRVGSRALARFRRAVADRRSDDSITFRGLKWLSRLGWALLVLFIVSSAVSTQFVARAMSDFSSNLVFAQNVGLNSIYLSVIMKYVVTHSISEIGWRDTDRQEEVDHRQYAYECAIDYQRRHRQLIEIANVNPDADGFFATTLDYVSWESLRTVPARMYSDAQVRAIKASGTQWARSYGATLLVGDRVPVSFATLGDVIGAQAVRFTTLPLEQATFHDKLGLFLLENGRSGMPAFDAHQAWTFKAFLLTVQAGRELRALLDAVAFAVGVGVTAAVALVIIPILFAVERTRDDIMRAFLSIPVGIVAHLQLGAECQRKAIRQAIDEDMEANDDDDDDEDAAATGDWRPRASSGGDAGGGGQQQDGGGVPGSGASAAGDADVDWSELYQLESIKASRKAKSLRGLGVVSSSTAAPSAGSSAAGVQQLVPPLPWGGVVGSWMRGLAATRTTTEQPPPPQQRHRRFHKGLLSSIVLTLYLTPLALQLAWFIGLRAWAVHTLQSVELLSAYAALSVSREGALRRVGASTIFYVASAGYATEMDFGLDSGMRALRELKNLNSLLTYSKPAVLRVGDDAATIPPIPDELAAMGSDHSLGDETSGTPGGLSAAVMQRLDGWTRGNLCVRLDEDTGGLLDGGEPFNLTFCEGYSAGLFLGGTRASINAVLGSSLELITRRSEAYLPPESLLAGCGVRYTTHADTPIGTLPPAPMNGPVPASMLTSSTVAAQRLTNATAVWVHNYSVVDDVNGAEMRHIETILDHASVGARAISSIYAEAAAEAISTFSAELRIYLGATASIFAALMLAFWVTSVRGLQRDLYEKQSMLLLLPAEVCGRTPAMTAIIASILAETESMSAAASVPAGGGGRGKGGRAAGGRSSESALAEGGLLSADAAPDAAHDVERD